MLHQSEVQLWVRPEVLELAILPILPAEKISVEMLSKLLQYARDLGERGYPTMTYETWRHIAVKKMGISAECCEVMFSSCRLFSQRTQDLHELDSLSCDSTVWTLELVTLLYLQRITSAHPRIMARQASLHSLTNDPWPGATGGGCGGAASGGIGVVSGMANGGGGVGPVSAEHLRKKKLPEEYNLEFIKDSLSELLSLLAGHLSTEGCLQSKAQKRRSGGDWRSVRELLGLMRGAGVVGVEVVRALDLVLGVTLGDRVGLKVLDVATDKTFCYQSGFLSKKNTFQKGLFEQWVLSRLDWAPHGEWQCTRGGRGGRGLPHPPHWAVTAATSHFTLQGRPVLPATATGGVERVVCITDLLEGIAVQLGDASTNTTPKKPLTSTSSAPYSNTSSPAHDPQHPLPYSGSEATTDGGVAGGNNVLMESSAPDNERVRAVARENIRGGDCKARRCVNFDSTFQVGVDQNGSEKNMALKGDCISSECIMERDVENKELVSPSVNIEISQNSYGNSEIVCAEHGVQPVSSSDASSNSTSSISESACSLSDSRSCNGYLSTPTTYSCNTGTDNQSSGCPDGVDDTADPPVRLRVRDPVIQWSHNADTWFNSDSTINDSTRTHTSASSNNNSVVTGSILVPCTDNPRTPSLSRSDSSCSSISPTVPLVLLDVKIKRCSKSQVYVLQPVRHVLLHKLHDCKVVLGPVRGRLRVTECRNLVVVAPARSVVVSADCRNLTLYTMTPHCPLLVGGGSPVGHQGVTLAPLNMHYPKLMQHLHMAGLKTNCNRWNLPLRLGVDGRPEQSDCGLLSPDEFHLLPLPFFPATVDGRPPLLPPGLPNAYVQAVEGSQQAVCGLRAEVREAALTEEQRALLQRAIDTRFRAWLRDTNKHRELDLLGKLSASLTQRHGVGAAAAV